MADEQTSSFAPRTDAELVDNATDPRYAAELNRRLLCAVRDNTEAAKAGSRVMEKLTRRLVIWTYALAAIGVIQIAIYIFQLLRR